MNERIRELAEQAGMIYHSEHQYDAFDEQKFAELIVRECMKCSKWVGTASNNPVEPIHTAHAINKRISKLFGVEK